MRVAVSIALAIGFCSAWACAVSAKPIETAPISVQPFTYGEVELLDSPFKQAMERNAEYLLSLEPDRLLHNTRKYCGLEPKGELYGGWEARGIAGHSLGHYLTAISQQYAATGDKRFKEKIDYTIGEMAECQKRYGDGYIGALPPAELRIMRAFEQGKVEPESAFFFKGGGWVPWYTQHKILAGLIDAWTLGGNKQAKEVTLKLADWVDKITRNLTSEQQQQMLRVEHGGMLESMVQVYALTGEQRYLDAAQRFYHKSVFDPLLAGEDRLAGLHANTQIPKIVGEARAFEVTGNPNGRKISEFFWNTVVHKRSWVIGGNSDREHFFPVGQAHEHLSPEAAESCNTYNMLRLTEHLFKWDPKPEYADYYERALYNQILASQEPEEGMFAYFMSLKPGHFKTYSTPFNSFWCCVGSGMENHTKYGRDIYFHDDDRLFVNLFIPSVLHWKEAGVELEQLTEYPYDDKVRIVVKKAGKKPISLMVRCPGWAATAPTFLLNGKPLKATAKPGEYAVIKRNWKAGDKLDMTIPMRLHTESLEGDTSKQAILYGPLVLAGDLGPVERTSSFPYAKEQWDNFRVSTVKVPTLVPAEDKSLVQQIEREPGSDLVFRTVGLGEPKDVVLKPFKDIFYDHYNVYWDVLSKQEWNARAEEMRKAEEFRRAEEARTVDVFHPGEQQPEIDHEVKSDSSFSGDAFGRKWRDARDGGWFEFKMKVLAGTPQVLRCTYWGGDTGNREFDILIDGNQIATQRLNASHPDKFFYVEYPIPANLLAGKDSIIVRIQAKPGKVAGGLFGAAVMKTESK